MLDLNKAIIFRIPRMISCNIPVFPAQAIGVISNYLLQNGIETYAYDLCDILGKRNAYNLYSKIYTDIPENENHIINDNREYDSYFDIIRNNIDFMNFSLVLISQEGDAESSLASILLSRYIKSHKQEMVIICGEPLEQTDYLAELKRNSKLDSIDFIVKGHNLESAVKIINSMKNGKGFTDIPAIIYYDRNKKQVVETTFHEKPQILDILNYDNLNLEYYKIHLSDHLPKRYISNQNDKMLLFPFKFIHGCPNHCAFCTSSFSKSLKHLNPEDVVRILKEMINKYKTNYFMFLNDTLNINYDYLDELCDRIIQFGIRIFWSDCVNARYFDKKLLFKMRKAGAVKLYFGLESGSDRMLELFKKGVSTSDILQCLRWSHEAGGMLSRRTGT